MASIDVTKSEGRRRQQECQRDNGEAAHHGADAEMVRERPVCFNDICSRAVDGCVLGRWLLELSGDVPILLEA